MPGKAHEPGRQRPAASIQPWRPAVGRACTPVCGAGGAVPRRRKGACQAHTIGLTGGRFQDTAIPQTNTEAGRLGGTGTGPQPWPTTQTAGASRFRAGTPKTGNEAPPRTGGRRGAPRSRLHPDPAAEHCRPPIHRCRGPPPAEVRGWTRRGNGSKVRSETDPRLPLAPVAPRKSTPQGAVSVRRTTQCPQSGFAGLESMAADPALRRDGDSEVRIHRVGWARSR